VISLPLTAEGYAPVTMLGMSTNPQ